MKYFLLTAENIFWIVTVPAIWEDFTKIVYERGYCENTSSFICLFYMLNSKRITASVSIYDM